MGHDSKKQTPSTCRTEIDELELPSGEPGDEVARLVRTDNTFLMLIDITMRQKVNDPIFAWGSLISALTRHVAQSFVGHVFSSADNQPVSEEDILERLQMVIHAELERGERIAVRHDS